MALAWRQVTGLIKSKEVAEPHPRTALHQAKAACIAHQRLGSSAPRGTITVVPGCYSDSHIENNLQTHPGMFLRLCPSSSMNTQSYLSPKSHQLLNPFSTFWPSCPLPPSSTGPSLVGSEASPLLVHTP